jgi:hypothetical protein
MMSALLKTFPIKADGGRKANFLILKLMEFPTAKRKVGKTRSVNVNPCHSACLKGEYILPQSPGVFTIIMRQTVRPLSTSSERYLTGAGLV